LLNEHGIADLFLVFRAARVTENIAESGNHGGGNFEDIHKVAGLHFGCDFGSSIPEFLRLITFVNIEPKVKRRLSQTQGIKSSGSKCELLEISSANHGL
jgi:hypothetical protein